MKKIVPVLIILGAFYFFKEIAIYPKKTKSSYKKVVYNKQKKEKTLEEMAKNTRSKIGKTNQIFRIDTRYKNEDNSYIGINFYSFSLTSSMLKIENVSTYAITRNFLVKAGYFIGYDKNGNELKFKQAQVKRGTDLPVIEIQFEKIYDLKYLVVGGIDRTLYGKGRVIYKIN